MRRTLIILLLVSSTASGQALFDSLRYSFSTTPKLTANLGSRNAFVTNEFAKMRSVFVGLNYADITRVGMSFNWMAKGFTSDHTHWLTDSTFIKKQKELRMFYFAPHIEYAFFRRGPWEGTIPIQLGIGWSHYAYQHENSSYYLSRDMIMLYEPAMTLQYRFLKYFGLGGGAGYRLMLKRNKHIMGLTHSPIYMFWFKVFFGTVYRDVVKRGRE